ncbi:hypothetical protein CBM2623_A10106 [Cupriavidus taiwanensis]|uniref:hypothetical protein n=1 Tax=Cupriavidus taiwanensis TaxID=164546 RepID=UPI000E129DEB|nr:hypothetical protein [Cupriavidus taiwanensis]SPA25372.1 hypothetical protein CBM2623_A10106 [Cupriavidus taiwanensis]
MLEKIIRIDNVGVFKAGVPAAITLKKVTVAYADNARGKSTLSALLRACGAGDAQSLQARKMRISANVTADFGNVTDLAR